MPITSSPSHQSSMSPSILSSLRSTLRPHSRNPKTWGKSPKQWVDSLIDSYVDGPVTEAIHDHLFGHTDKGTIAAMSSAAVSDLRKSMKASNTTYFDTLPEHLRSHRRPPNSALNPTPHPTEYYDITNKKLRDWLSCTVGVKNSPSGNHDTKKGYDWSTITVGVHKKKDQNDDLPLPFLSDDTLYPITNRSYPSTDNSYPNTDKRARRVQLRERVQSQVVIYVMVFHMR